ncbi:unnamed protein product, partial [Musa acuminata subsp. burmannicoides]
RWSIAWELRIEEVFCSDKVLMHHWSWRNDSHSIFCW